MESSRRDGGRRRWSIEDLAMGGSTREKRRKQIWGGRGPKKRQPTDRPGGVRLGEGGKERPTRGPLTTTTQQHTGWETAPHQQTKRTSGRGQAKQPHHLTSGSQKGGVPTLTCTGAVRYSTFSCFERLILRLGGVCDWSTDDPCAGDCSRLPPKIGTSPLQVVERYLRRSVRRWRQPARKDETAKPFPRAREQHQREGQGGGRARD